MATTTATMSVSVSAAGGRLSGACFPRLRQYSQHTQAHAQAHAQVRSLHCTSPLLQEQGQAGEGEGDKDSLASDGAAEALPSWQWVPPRAARNTSGSEEEGGGGGLEDVLPVLQG